MPRFRRYRVFLIFAAALTFTLYHFSHLRIGDGISKASLYGLGNTTPEEKDNGGHAVENKEPEGPVNTNKPVADIGDLPYLPKPAVIAPIASSKKPAIIAPVASLTKPVVIAPAASSTKPVVIAPVVSSTKQLAVELDVTTAGAEVVSSTSEALLSIQTAPSVPLEEASEGDGKGDSDADADAIVDTVIHWENLPEHFPVAPENLIHLPTGTPKKMPRIQFKFPAEPADAKAKREKRQAAVKKEFLHAWSGYKKFAWTHDELKPVIGSATDPFCGWAATLVDSLDTLWIMGLKEEFEEALVAVEKIDFTTTSKSKIPVFETTIRYLGGMLAAYDISDAKYPVLLKKATELGDLLMGVFDTPNRMPILHYSWKPIFASQPHRAGPSSNLAELGSLSMEFTRLAQLTGEPKYYDAVARITNELVEWQKRGTMLPGLFPDVVDASGCNKTAPSVEQPATPTQTSSDPLGYQPPYTAPVKDDISESEDTIALQIIDGEPSVANIESVDSAYGTKPVYEKASSKRQLPEHAVNPTTTRSFDENWDCATQGLTGDPHSKGYFSMGGGQDSTYEYFSKMWLLLGGLDDKYRKLYLDSVDGLKTHLLFRPMTPENRDILFTAKVGTYGHPEEEDDLDISYEITHLTCFIGGMVGMGSKLFNLDSDMAIAKRLTDGCVWAYEATETGIMPEYAQAVPCDNVASCKWDEALWHRYLDPHWKTREKNIQFYEQQRIHRQEKAEKARKVEEAELAAKEQERALNGDVDAVVPTVDDFVGLDGKAAVSEQDTEPPAPLHNKVADNPAVDNDTKLASPPENGASAVPTTSPRHSKRNPPADPPSSVEGVESDAELAVGEAGRKLYDAKLAATEAEFDPDFSNRVPEPADAKLAVAPQVPTWVPKVIAPPGELLPDPTKPPTHEEYVAQKLDRENLPRGFAQIENARYLLRPEAIESVFYMHRMTGDPEWSIKGWNMFKAVINATRTEWGHSAIKSVTSREEPVKLDSMESFWLAETLKYFYLLFSEPEVVSLDEWVLNTEAHPFKRPA